LDIADERLTRRIFVMRTEFSTTRPTMAAASLTDFSNAVRCAGGAKPTKVFASLTVASRLPALVPNTLQEAADKTIDAALAGNHPVDPLLGHDVSVAVSTLNSAVKRSGTIIEKALAKSLEQQGFVVLTQVSMQLSAAARDLVANNAPATLRGVAIGNHAPMEGPTVVFDLLVWCPRTRTAWLLEIKRGNGPTELRKIKPIAATLRAGALQVKAYLAKMGIKVKRVEARVVDYYGHSGFPDDVRITGDHLDRTFRAPIRSLIEQVLDGLRARLFTAVPALLMRAIAAAHQPPQAGDQQRTITLPGGVKVAPEHIRAIELPPRRRRKAKPAASVVPIGASRRPGGTPAVTL
jgi:hypothetical protein